MKTKIIAGVLMLGAIVPAKAQIFGPNGTAGAIVGGVIGAVIGNNSGHRTWEGAAIGAGTGIIVGSIIDNNRQQTRVVEYNRPITTYYETPTYYKYPGENFPVVQRVVVVETPVVYYNTCPAPVYVNRERAVTYYNSNHHHGTNNQFVDHRNPPPSRRIVPSNPPPSRRIVPSNPPRSNHHDAHRGRGK